MLPQGLEGFAHIREVLLNLKAFLQHVVYIHLNVPPDLAFKHLIDESLINGPRILQFKGNDLVIVESSVGDEGGFLLVGPVHLYLVISQESIHETKSLVVNC